MHIINITVRDKIAVNPAQGRYVCGNSDFVVHFDFDAEWDAYETKTARFVKEDGTYKEQVFTGTECPVPVISDTYKLQVGVFAGNLSTTTAAYVPCKKSVLCGGGVPADPEPDVYNQVMAALNENTETAKGMEEALQEAFGEGGLFLVNMGNDNLTDRTQDEIRAAVAAGKTCILKAWDGRVFAYRGESEDTHAEGKPKCPTFVEPASFEYGIGITIMSARVRQDRSVSYSGYSPVNTPNPRALTIAGKKYYGDEAVSVMPAPADKTATAYLRWNGTAYVAATIAELKADLGLN